MTKLNHYPIPTARKVPAHASEGDTAFAAAAITCPHCRSNLSAKIAMHLANAKSAKAGSQVSIFEQNVANNWQAVLDNAA